MRLAAPVCVGVCVFFVDVSTCTLALFEKLHHPHRPASRQCKHGLFERVARGSWINER